MRFFLDANVLISGMVFRGNEFRLLLFAAPGKTEHHFVTSEHVIDEITRVMVEKFPKHVNLVKEFLGCLEIEVISKDAYIRKMNGVEVVRDRHDRHVLASAEAAGCDAIISGDKDLLSLKRFGGAKILTPKKVLVDFFEGK